MIKRLLIFIVFVIVLVLLTVFILRPENDEQEVGIPTAVNTSKDVEDEVEATEISVEEQELLKQFTPEEIENLKYSHQAAQAANQNVIFYGLCLDQDGNPIEGVQVNAEVTKMRKSMLSVVVNDSFKYTEKLQAITGLDGRFEFKDEGSSLSLKRMEKDGYLAADRALYGGYQFGQILYGNSMAGMHEADPLKPVLFTLWKKSGGSAAVQLHDKNGYRPEIGMQKDDMGKSFYFDLSTRSKAASSSKNTIEVTASNDADSRWDPEQFKHVGRGSNTAWSYTLKIQGGGVIQTEDVFLFRPPEDGYKEFFTFQVPEGADGWISQVEDQKFYFKTAGGNYGAFVLNVRSAADGGMGFRFDKLYFNPSGKRDLENF